MDEQPVDLEAWKQKVRSVDAALHAVMETPGPGKRDGNPPVLSQARPERRRLPFRRATSPSTP